MNSIILPFIPPPSLILSRVTSIARTACSPKAARFPVIGCEDPNRILSSVTPRASSHSSAAASLLEASLLLPEASLLELSLLELSLAELPEESSSSPQPTATSPKTAKIASNFHSLLFIIPLFCTSKP